MMSKKRGTAKPGTQSELPEEVGTEDATAYEVGYGKPPVHSRFQPGRSGNPKGKARGRKSYKTTVAATLHEKITVQTPRGRKRMSKLEALIQTNMNNALKGDPKATDHILKIAREYGHADAIAEAIDTAASAALSEADRAILARHVNPAEPEEGD